IGEMESSIPELAAETAKAPAEPHQAATAPSAVMQSVASAGHRETSGIFGLITDLFELSGKIRTIDQSIAATNAMAQTSQNFRNPVMTQLKSAASRGDDFAQQADSSNAAQLEVLKKQLDELTDEFRQVSAVMIPLQHQSILFDLDKKTLTRWRDAVEGQFVDE